MFDTHCHLDLLSARGIGVEAAVKQAENCGVQHIIVPGIDASNWPTIANYAQKYSSVEWAIGIHPMFVTQESLAEFDLMQAKLESGADCIAIGECGLDFFHGRDNQALQTEVLIAQLKLAQRFELPVLLHVRKAHQELIQLLKQYPLSRGGIVHGFSGSYEQGMDFVRLGFSLGIGGTITYQRANKTRNAVACLPLEALVLETDAPDMPLFGYQGQPNQPKMVRDVLACCVTLRQESEQTITQKMTENATKLFNLIGR
ncbi:TatD family hydrolase [Vibrio taketomensis]|uniref:TatD family hydrolase n=1 Tax=Vibrio taketomensis TaxID=2572923 RepID=UPI001389E582|nr:TatD family hydrolase [Vibrio taketomensis]